MKKTGIFYGSSMGRTEKIARMIREKLGKQQVDIFDIKNIDVKTIQAYENLILGTSAWGIGDMQDDWEDFIDAFVELDLSDKKIALFGLGDQEKYPESFADGLGVLYCRLPAKSNVIGFWPVDGYSYYFSMAEKDGRFVGMCIDEDSQPELTEERVTKWVKQLQKELK
ncbi:MAG: flavodoxin [Bacteroidales bacterium]|nr:flavodoxin [Bacteroidales bacterium]